MQYSRTEKKPDSIFDACRKGDTERVEKYVSDKGCVTEGDDNKMTMLHHAAFSGNMNIVQLILSTQTTQKLDLDAVDVGGWTALHYAAERGNKDVVVLLLHEGANVNAKDEMRKTPLHLAAAAGHADIVSALLGSGAAKHAKSVSSWDAKQYAETSGHADVVTLLQ